MWLCLAPVAPAARGPHVGRSYGRTLGGGRGEDGDRRGARMRAPRLRRQVCTAESCYRSPVKVVRGGNRSGEVARFISARLLRAPADPPGWTGAAGLTDAVPACRTNKTLKLNNLRRNRYSSRSSGLTARCCCITVS